MVCLFDDLYLEYVGKETYNVCNDAEVDGIDSDYFCSVKDTIKAACKFQINKMVDDIESTSLDDFLKEIGKYNQIINSIPDWV